MVNHFSMLPPCPAPDRELVTHVYVVDSRERDVSVFPNPADYTLAFSDAYKNVVSIELKGSSVPKTEYNVNSGNNLIPFNVVDSITRAVIKGRGSGYTDGVYACPVSAPAISTGDAATVSVTVVGGRVSAVSVTTAGSGYLRGSYGNRNSPPDTYAGAGATLDLSSVPRSGGERADIDLEVGYEMVAELRMGQYDFSAPDDASPGLCREVSRALREAVTKEIANGRLSGAADDFFPFGAGVNASCFLTSANENASGNNRVNIQRGSGAARANLELLWSQRYDSSAIRVLGYGSSGLPIDQTSGAASNAAWSALPVTGRNDYDLMDSPAYSILSFSECDRLESTSEELDAAFATVVFDANAPNVVHRAPGLADGTGDSGYNTLLAKPGVCKAIKGQDFDRKIREFTLAPLTELSRITVRFSKLNGTLMNFHGRDHLLVFEIKTIA